MNDDLEQLRIAAEKALLEQIARTAGSAPGKAEQLAYAYGIVHGATPSEVRAPRRVK